MAQLVEYDLATVGVAGSNPVSRSSKALDISDEMRVLFILYYIIDDIR